MNGQWLLLLPPALPSASSSIITATTEGLPGEQQEVKAMPKCTLPSYVLLPSPPPLSELKNPSCRK